MYHKTRKKAAADRKMAAMRAAKAQRRETNGDDLVDTNPAPDVSDLRRVVIVIDYDFDGARIDTFRLRRSGRIDSYRVEHNGTAVEERIGWANFCKRLSAHYPRITSPRSIDRH